MNNNPIITVDGPSGTGKGTICGYLSSWLKWHVLDSGALYRVVALAAEKKNITYDDEVSLENLTIDLNVKFLVSEVDESINILLDGENITDKIRTEQIGNDASILARMTTVRTALLARQKAFHRAPGLIADGRDMGTVVFPQAELKIFLIANAVERAKRRFNQLKNKGINANLRDLSAKIAERDERDTKRAVSPLKPADDAVIIDTSELDINKTVAQISELVRQRIPNWAEFK